MQGFGGKWTIEKLDILNKYFGLYLNSLKNYRFKKVYIDAFAGSGEIAIGEDEENVKSGSTRLALSANPSFDEYIFIEKDKKYCEKLQQMVDNDFPQHKDIVRIINKDANIAIEELLISRDWRYYRAILFIDPYASQFNWTTLEKIANNHCFDVWFLFPYSVVNRLITKRKEDNSKFENCLNRILGTKEWKEAFYKEDNQLNLFSDEPSYIKSANLETIKEYLINRLRLIFAKVHRNPRVLYNSKNSPLFIFIFAMSNESPKAQKLAMKFADYVLKDNETK